MPIDQFSIFDSSPKPTLIFDENQKIVYYNQVARQKFWPQIQDKSPKEFFKAQSKGQGYINACFAGKGPISNNEVFEINGYKFNCSFHFARVGEQKLVVASLEFAEIKQSEDRQIFRSFETALHTLGELTSSSKSSIDQKIQGGLNAALDLFGLPLGIISRIQGSEYTVLYSQSRIDGAEIPPGTIFDLGGTYCDVTWRNHSLVAVPKAAVDDIYSNHPSYKNFKLETYVGIPLVVEGVPYGTLSLASPEEYEEGFFSTGKLEFFQLLAKWIENTIEVRKKDSLHRQIQSQNATVQTLFEGVFNESPIAIGVASVDRKLQLANKAFLNLYGLKEEEVFGRCTSTLYADPDDYKRQSSRFSRENRAQNFEMYTVNYKRKDSSTFIGETMGYPVHDQNGVVIGFIGQVIDKTAEIQRESELEEQRLIAQQNSKLAAIGELAAGVGHEINNPLQIVNGYTELIKRKLKTDGSESIVSKELEKVQCAIKRIVGIVEELRTFSRVETSAKPFNVKDAIEETMFLLSEIYQREGVNLVFTHDRAKDYFLEGYKGKFHQVLMNLLSNAKDATEKRESRHIKINLEKTGDTVNISVSDNGLGISKEVQDKIFNPFFTTKAPGKGTGIGLAVSHKIIREHGGKIECVSTPEEGTRFIIAMPQFSGANQLNSNEQQAEKQGLPFKEVLIVDDEIDIGTLLQTFFEDEGVRTTLVENAEAAIELLSQGREFDVVITDMQMPGMNGLDFLELIKTMDPTIKRVLMTGGVDGSDAILERIRAISETILYKPFFPEEAIEKIAKTFY